MASRTANTSVGQPLWETVLDMSSLKKYNTVNRVINEKGQINDDRGLIFLHVSYSFHWVNTSCPT